jgi:hypothetical protein
MQISEQTTADIKSMIETLDQRIHEMTCDANAVNMSNPAEVAALADLRDLAKRML